MSSPVQTSVFLLFLLAISQIVFITQPFLIQEEKLKFSQKPEKTTFKEMKFFDPLETLPFFDIDGYKLPKKWYYTLISVLFVFTLVFEFGFFIKIITTTSSKPLSRRLLGGSTLLIFVLTLIVQGIIVFLCKIEHVFYFNNRNDHYDKINGEVIASGVSTQNTLQPYFKQNPLYMELYSTINVEPSDLPVTYSSTVKAPSSIANMFVPQLVLSLSLVLFSLYATKSGKN